MVGGVDSDHVTGFRHCGMSFGAAPPHHLPTRFINVVNHHSTVHKSATAFKLCRKLE